MEGRNFDDGKAPLHLIPAEAEIGAARVLAFGAQKYKDTPGADYNWRHGMDWSRTLSSALRHLNAFKSGEDIDPESGLPHIDCALVRLMFLSTYQKTGTGRDDRFKRPSVADQLTAAPPEAPAAKEPEIRVGQSWRDSRGGRYYRMGAVDGEFLTLFDIPGPGEVLTTRRQLRKYYTLVDTTLELR